ncbi:hypothetical protein [Streptomyces sp. NPDC047071]|uniref:hypothetical protein n=1 Tax=Streptomyces sp. NPDC047071 TaxID=3154808 RepID=UPI003456BA29
MPMTAPLAKARERKPRTRTKKVSHRPALMLSKIPPNHIDLRDPQNAVVHCPDCRTWCPITGMQGGGTQKLVPHHTAQAGLAVGIRCRGSNRRIEIDMTLPQWFQALADATKVTAHRRTNTVPRKPAVAIPPAVGQMATKRRAAAEDEKHDRRDGRARRAMWQQTARAVRDTDRRRADLPVGTALPREAREVPLQPQDAAAHDARQAALGQRYPERAVRRPRSGDQAVD